MLILINFIVYSLRHKATHAHSCLSFTFFMKFTRFIFRRFICNFNKHQGQVYYRHVLLQTNHCIISLLFI